MVYCGEYFYPIFFEKMPEGSGNDVRRRKFLKDVGRWKGHQKANQITGKFKILFRMISK